MNHRILRGAVFLGTPPTPPPPPLAVILNQGLVMETKGQSEQSEKPRVNLTNQVGDVGVHEGVCGQRVVIYSQKELLFREPTQGSTELEIWTAARDSRRWLNLTDLEVCMQRASRTINQNKRKRNPRVARHQVQTQAWS